jgi:cellulose synthase/poly-beta-1,6-N-acetylglucosamine synthase-like glycosyltransferase
VSAAQFYDEQQSTEETWMFKDLARKEKIRYILLFIPFILAYVSWRWFPLFAEYVIIHGFGYSPSPQPVSWLWSAVLWFFYTWYTFFAIAICGFLIVAAWFWKKEVNSEPTKDYPMISFIVPAYNEERVIERCISSLFECCAHYSGPSEIIIVDDGSTDGTYERAWVTIQSNQRKWSRVPAKVVRHTANLGKAEAIRTGINKAMGEIVATVDADTWWEPTALVNLINYVYTNNKVAASGYIHPSDGKDERNLYVILQMLEYSQGLGILRRAQAMGDAIPVVPGPMGIYRSEVLRAILNEKRIKSVTEDLEVTLEMQKRKTPIGYTDQARSVTVAPTSFRNFWNQRLRWSMGWLQNLIGVHKELLFNKRWLSLLLWYNLLPGYLGAVIELAAVFCAPLLFWYAPDKIFFLYNTFLFLLFIFAIGIIQQAIALKFAYNNYNHRHLLLYTPLYSILRFINICARFNCLIKYALGKRGSWRKIERPHLS